MNKNLLFLISMIIILIVSGCGGTIRPSGPTIEEVQKGSDGVVINFIEGAPPNKIIEGNPFQVGIRAKNKGITKVTRGYLLLGFEKEFLELTSWQTGSTDERISIELEAKSMSLPDGDEDLYMSNFIVKSIGEQREQIDTTLFATTCYDYASRSDANICIDTDMYGLKMTEKACSAGNVALQPQGGPVTVSMIETNMLYSQDTESVKPQLKIYLNNVGGGKIITNGKSDLACSSQPLTKDDLNKIKISAEISGTQLTCKPDVLELTEKSRYTICTMDVGFDANNPSYVAPVSVKLEYGYMDTISKSIQIIRVGI